LVDSFEAEQTQKKRVLQEEMRAKVEALRKKEDDKKVKHRQKMVENMGDWDKGDVLHRVVGMKREKETGQIMCKCEWETRINDVWPI
jgi:RNase P/RNase MRP subunit POP5